ncbi:MAG: FdtA/QdtA family cupin domain-containing protein, partial [Pyrinomonadaceae bacterium]|nr:FdtA/QdtA family cupin domain-containing protein [Sphingobacteriaceae bacterium]
MEIEIRELDKPQLINFNSFGEREIGFISVVQNSDKLPFVIQRVYWTYLTPADVTRGHHAHKELKQLIFAVSGNLKIELENVKGEKEMFELNSPNIGLYVPKLFWR